MRHHNRISIASFLLAILMASSGSGSLQAQGGKSGVSAAPSRPQFEVASIKPNRSLSPPRAGFRANAFEAMNATARQLLTLAYGSDPQNVVDEIIGGPAWLDSERFDVSARGATADGAGNQAQGRAMLQSLLEDRFSIRVHRERQERPVYRLVMTSGDRPLAPGLKRAPLDCGTRADRRPAGTPGIMYCGIDRAPGRSTGRSMPIRLLADTLSSRVGRNVIDETGLSGEWDWDLEWTPGPSEPVSTGDITGPPAPSDGPSIFAAVQEQLGLRLESSRALLDVLVIDAIERPSPN
jgi:bla regulator protein blaR1